MLGPLAERGVLGGADHGTRVALLTGSQPTAARRAALLDVVSGEAGIVVGTHALLQDTVEFADLGLVVVDEQHRFGVEQRDALRSKAEVAAARARHDGDADPAHRGDDGLRRPRGLDADRAARRPVADRVARRAGGEKPHFLDRAWQRVREEVEAGHQAYVVCPRIGGDVADAEPSAGGEPDAADEATSALRPAVAVLDVAPMLAEGPLAGLRVEVLHGRLPADEKDDVMRRFAAGEVDVLVATTVIEVGVDVPNATVMVVLDADRFGVSQLHQLRGRVGRGVGARAVPAGHRRRGRHAGPRAAGRGGRHARRLRAVPARPGDPPGGRRARRLAVRPPLQPAAAVGAARRGGHRAGPRGRDRRWSATTRTWPGTRRCATAVEAVLADERAEYLEKA